MLNLGLIGFGRFGQFAAKHLRSRLHIFVWDIRDLRKKAGALGLTWGTLEEAASCRIVLLATPIAEIPAILARIVAHLRPGALLLDVASVKMLPVKWMLEATPDNVEVIGTHPLFGPQSARAGIDGQTVVLCPARTSRLDKVSGFLGDFGLDVKVTTPEDHDRQMARAQSLTHFVARGLEALRLPEQELQTPTFVRLLEIVENLSEDAPELFHDLQTYNPFAAKARHQLLTSLQKIDKQRQSLVAKNN